MAKSDAMISLDDAQAIGFRVVDCADRVRVADMCLPGAEARWSFKMDGVTYEVTVAVRRDKS